MGCTAFSVGTPVHDVELSAYFISKYEMTQGQWDRLIGGSPEMYDEVNAAQTKWYGYEDIDKSNYLYPVVEVSWLDSASLLEDLRLSLPTEAQWEYACRSGTSSVYWSGNKVESLQGVANLADQYGKDHGTKPLPVWEPWLDDGNAEAGKVGSYRPNSFGLHDVHGNAQEWCLDAFSIDAYKAGRSTNPVTTGKDSAPRVYRGGSFYNTAKLARSASRSGRIQKSKGRFLGLRPAINIVP
jgi:formylglycine-generating enzyme required for sulfatase activity